MDLKEIVAEKLRMRPFDADVDRDVLVARAIAYIDEAQAMGIALDAARRDLDAPQPASRQQLPAAHRYPDRFRGGITGIIGPNGSGKSTLLEAIAWALYGMPAARGTRDSIRSYRAAPRAQVKVELDFDLGGHRYLVSRGLTNAELFLDGSSVPIATSISAVSDLLRRRLGMSHDEFFNTYFTGQKELGVMAAMGPSERAQFLSRVLGYERLRTAQELDSQTSQLDRRRDQGPSRRHARPGRRASRPRRGAGTAWLRRRRSSFLRSSGATARAPRSTASRRSGSDPARARRRCRRWSPSFAWSRASAMRARARHGSHPARAGRDRPPRARSSRALTLELAALSGLEAELRELERASNEQARHKTLSDGLRADQ